MRAYRSFTWKDSAFRICSTEYDLITREIVRQRGLLERYIRRHPKFKEALVPTPTRAGAPLVARRMQEAARLTGVGPMAAVAGAIAQLAAEAAFRAGAREAIIDNGGDLYIASDAEVTVALYAGENKVGGRLAFAIPPDRLPLSVCSSSSRMGHSMSFGDCDLATVVSRDAALADAAATLAANLVKRPEDIAPTLDRVGEIPGVIGVVLVKADQVGLIGDLPKLVRNVADKLPVGT